MAKIDQFIDFMIKNKGERFVIRNNEKCNLVIGGQTKPVSTIMNAQQIQALISEVLPEESRASYEAGGNAAFSYGSTLGPQQIAVEQGNGAIQLSIGDSGVAAPAAERVEAQVPSATPTEDSEEAQPTIAVGGSSLKKVGHLDELFRYLKANECSDLHCASNDHPIVRQHGIMKILTEYEVWSHDMLKELLWAVCPERNKEQWESDHDTDFAYEIKDLARFRCNYFRDRHGIGAVFRLIPTEVVTAEVLGLTKAMTDLCYLSKGLVVVTGPTGSGKSTTLAALMHYVNNVRDDHVITIEDPIEFVHENIRCLINQREVHAHTESFPRALRAALREDPDVVLVGEMRDLETIAIAIETAETGHLVFGALHTSTAPSTVDRIIDQFPPAQQEQIRVMLSESLMAIIAQTLCRKIGGGRIAAFELLLCDSATRNLIREGKTFQLQSIMQVGKGKGMITMNESLMAHVKNKIVEPHEAYVRALDKVGLLQLFEKENIDFKPGEGIKTE